MSILLEIIENLMILKFFWFIKVAFCKGTSISVLISKGNSQSIQWDAILSGWTSSKALPKTQNVCTF